MAAVGPLGLSDAGLTRGDASVDDAGVLGFHEHFDPWRARVWLEVAGPGWRVPVDLPSDRRGDAARAPSDGYRDLRRALRTRYGDRPFTADWTASGRFDALVLGLPPAPAMLVAVVLVVAVVTLTGIVAGPAVAVASVGGWVWGVGRLRAAVVVRPDGVIVGPAWTPLTPWHEVGRITVTEGRRGVRLRVWTDDGLLVATVPAALWPACRARLRRLGGLVPEVADVDTAERYLRWRALAAGGPWGVLAGALLAGAASGAPFVVWTYGGLAAAAAGFVGAAVEAWLTGWRNGGVFWMTAAWAVVLVGLTLAAWQALPA